MAKVVLENVCKDFGKVKAVSCFFLDVEDREFCVLLGPSGCGKSTTLHMIAGLEEMNDGNIYIGDKCVNDVGPRNRDIAMVFQDYALYPHMTVRQNMAFGLKLRKFSKSEIEARVQEAAEILGIKELLDRKPRELSGGQRQRVALGRAIVRKPAVFLFDEPLSNLDAKLRAQMRTEISKLHDRLQTTMIYVTHDQVEAMTMGTKIVVMKDGEMLQIGPPLEIYSYPVDKFVAGFIGSPAMNFVDVQLVEQESELCAISDGLQLSIPPAKKAYLNNFLNAQVILGIRPEHLEDNSFADKSVFTETFSAVVDVVETLGAEVQLDVTAGKHALIARVDARSAASRHAAIELAVNMDKIHFFEKDPPHLRITTEKR
ncbi:MAG: sn-glycerol-3-phosphate ABC transporter ATP-binding protein UgpC [Desulfobacterales bacterium]|nr:MAG: sn-glycerol-3-phosphate ABC transporter ATP-binding protein UgpC [Desulfobacterales bacterium]